jgi:hypothetical protein
MYFTSDIIRFQNDKADTDNLLQKRISLVQPFSSTPDVLGPFFDIHEEKPNIVMIIVKV